MARVEISQEGLQQLIYDPDSPVQRDLDRRGVRIETYQVEHCPVETGRLRGDIHTERAVASDGSPARHTGSGVEYVLDVILGTGLYGTKKQRIYPKTKKALRWVDAGGTHFAKSTKGQKPQDFMSPSLQAGRDA